MTTAVGMLADFSVRLALGLSIMLLILSWKSIPLRFFRVQMQVVLGLLVLAALDQARAAGAGAALWTLVAGACLAYGATVAWGLGLPLFGLGASALAALTQAIWLAAESQADHPAIWAINAASRAASGFLMGSTLTAMLLGHQYLTAPTMTIDPLKRVLVLMSWALLARAACALSGIWASHAIDPSAAIRTGTNDLGTILAVRWGVGFGAFAVAVFMAWRSAAIRSTQSATGILYITMIFVLFGELTSLVLAQAGKVMP